MKKILTAFFVLTLILPAPASALSVEDLQKQISALLAQIEILRQQISQQSGQNCAVFSSDLQIGNSGSSVSSLQKVLIKEGFDIDNGEVSSNNFGESTASAVVGFQEKYRYDVLTPAGLQRGTGYVGARTRAKLNSLGCNNTSTVNTPTQTYPSNTSPIVTNSVVSILYPTNNTSFVSSGPGTVTWTDVGADANAKYSILVKAVSSTGYSSGAQVVSTVLSRAQAGCSASDKCYYPLTVSVAGTYLLTITNQTSGSSATITFVVNKISVEGSVQVGYPNGGEEFLSEKGAFIASWKANNENVNLYLTDYNGNTLQDLGANLSGTSFNVLMNSDMLQKDVNKFKIKVCLYKSPSVCDTSDNPFSFVSSPPTITVLYPNGGETFKDWDYSNISWSSNVPWSYNMSGFDVILKATNSGNTFLIRQNYIPPTASDKYSISWSVDGAHQVQKDTQFVVRVCKSGDYSICDESNSSFTINP